MDKENNKKLIFQDLSFSLITYSKDLTEKRADIIIDIIRINGGLIINLNSSKINIRN